ncbi:hypothetical protein ACHWQZ_G005133 [Mnemiopsis leidyi]
MPTVAERFNFDKVESDGQNFLLDTVKLCKVNSVQELNYDIVSKTGTKGDLAAKFLQAMQLIERQHNLIINQRVHVSQNQCRMIELQDQVISLQERLLSAKEGLSKAKEVSEQFKSEIVKSFQKGVSSAVKKSFSDVVKSSGINNSAATISTESIKSVAKQIVLEEELGKNIMIFGLCEEDNENICTKVSEVLESLGEKPRVMACRIGKKLPSEIRPVKVSFSGSSIVQQILKKSSDWTAVKPAVDLETTPLEIKTNSTLESGDRVYVLFFNSQGEYAGVVYIYFISTPKYWLYWCSSYTNFPSNLPAAVDKVWRISLNKTSGIRLQIHCNDVEVANFLLSDDTCSNSDWREYWSRDVEKIAFSEYDTASVYYRLYQQGNWTAVKPAVDLETTPLEIKTNSTLESGDYVEVYFYNSQGEEAGAVWIYFNSTPQYGLVWCSSRTNFTSNLPAAVDKVWRISLTRTSGIRLQIHCNDVEVVNTLLSDDTCGYSDWRKFWSRDVEKIAFPEYDTASDYYRLYQQGEGNWTAVKPAVDLETTPLEIKTNSTLESGDRVTVYFYNSQGEDAGAVWIYFNSTPQYGLVWCSSRTNFTSNLPAAVDKVWRISLTRTSGIRLQIHCNDVEVVNFLLSDDTCRYSDWREYWSRDVEKIAFYTGDTASDYYRRFKPGSCTGLKAAWTETIATTTKFPVDPGTVVEVTCSDTGTFNNGSSQVTCASGTQFTYQIEPLCIDLGKYLSTVSR